MADTVDTRVLANGPRKYVVRFTNASDGTGESAAIKVALSGLTGPSGRPPTAIKLMKAEWNVSGFTAVKAFWDHTTDDEMVIMSGQGQVDYSDAGGLMDPRSAGGTGDVLFTTVGAAATNVYDITMWFVLKD